MGLLHSAHLTLRSVKAMSTHIEGVASRSHNAPVQFRLPFKASEAPNPERKTQHFVCPHTA